MHTMQRVPPDIRAADKIGPESRASWAHGPGFKCPRPLGHILAMSKPFTPSILLESRVQGLVAACHAHAAFSGRRRGRSIVAAARRPFSNGCILVSFGVSSDRPIEIATCFSRPPFFLFVGAYGSDTYVPIEHLGPSNGHVRVPIDLSISSSSSHRRLEALHASGGRLHHPSTCV